MRKEYLPKNKDLKPYSRKLRKNMTPEEKHLWYDYLSGHPLRFNRQRIIGGYIVDFYCDKAKLVIELDGAQHYEEDALIYDSKRTEFLHAQGLQVLRILNKEIQSNFHGVCETIDQLLCDILKKEASYE